MRFTHRALVSSLLFAAACTAGSNSGPDDPAIPDPDQPGTSVDQTATNLGVTVLSTDANGAPRLLRAIVPRPASPGATASAAARDHIAALAPLWVDRAPMGLVETGVQVLRNGAAVVQLAQKVDGVLVDEGRISVLLHANNALAAVAGTLLPATRAPAFASTPTNALDRALDRQFGASRPAMAIRAGAATDDWQSLEVGATPTLKVTEARARRVLATIDDKLQAAYEVEMFSEAAPDPLSEDQSPRLSARSFLVTDAGVVAREVNLEQNDAFVYRVLAETTGVRRPLDGALASFAPHPSGVPDGSSPSLIPIPLVVMDSFNSSLDPWLPGNATTTAGNNAEAFADLDGNNAFTTGDIRPEVRSSRTLNFTYNHALEPLATPDQSKAASINAFFMVNWLHDWFYDSGFTEATRNAQNDNFGRGGVGNDRLLIAAQAGATVGSRNNASMATPNDGARPRMRMFLWTAGADSLLTAPAGVVRSDTFSNGPRTFFQTGDLIVGTDTTAPTDDGCQALSNVAGKIVLLTYAAMCNSQVSVNNARAGGAIGVILADGELDNPRAFGGSAAANIPGLVVGRSDGLALKAALDAGPVSITLESTARGPERDGDLDNTVVAHEWGHYMHHRLAQCGNSAQCAGMSEGWGDFMALLMMVREGDNREGVYAVGPYALANGDPDTAYFGIRRFPYSRDRTRNDLSFRHIGDENPLPTTTPGFPGGVNSEVHNAGEIWTTVMWEAFNVLADQHGVNVARRRTTDYIVAGLLIHPTNATFTEARDAILTAASALDTEDMLLMAAAFAGRGMGSCAASPARTTPGNAGVVESGTLAAKLRPGTPTVTDDGPRGDRDGSLEPGEGGVIHVQVANGGVIAAEQVTLTATSSTPGVTIGAPRPLALLQAFSTSELTLPVSVASTVPRGTVVTLTLRVAGDFTCDRGGITISLPVTIGATGVVARTGPEALRVGSAPAVSLAAFDAQVCIAQDTP